MNIDYIVMNGLWTKRVWEDGTCVYSEDLKIDQDEEAFAWAEDNGWNGEPDWTPEGVTWTPEKPTYTEVMRESYDGPFDYSPDNTSCPVCLGTIPRRHVKSPRPELCHDCAEDEAREVCTECGTPSEGHMTCTACWNKMAAEVHSARML